MTKQTKNIDAILKKLADLYEFNREIRRFEILPQKRLSSKALEAAAASIVPQL